MPKIFDIKAGGDNKPINLKSKSDNSFLEKKRLVKKKNIFKKKKNPIIEVKDLYSDNEVKKDFLYVHGEKFKVPKYLGRLLKMALAGAIIIFAINAVNIYYKGKSMEENIAT